jgi:hypothetical protein
MKVRGRLVERVKLPADLVDALEAEAGRQGKPPEVLAGDLVASVLPDALAEAARAALEYSHRELAKAYPEQTNGRELPPPATGTPCLHEASTSIVAPCLPVKHVKAQNGRRS